MVQIGGSSHGWMLICYPPCNNWEPDRNTEETKLVWKQTANPFSFADDLR